jgi:hypothetical protein
MKAKGGRGVMAEIEDVLAELRHRIMGPFESGPPKPARRQQETNEEELAMAQSVNIEYQRHGSAAVALRRLAHPGRDGGVVAGDDPVSEPVNPERGGGVVVGDDPISPLIRRLSTNMPELMEEVVAFIERRTAELNRDDGVARGPAESVAPAALVRATPTLQDDDTARPRSACGSTHRCSPASMPPPSAWGSAERRGCTLRPRSAWRVGDDLGGP